MIFEDELEGIWGKWCGGEPQAHEDYLFYKQFKDVPVSELNTWHLTYDRFVRCKCTYLLFKGRLIEALTSSLPYVREWGKLVAKEQEDARS